MLLKGVALRPATNSISGANRKRCKGGLQPSDYNERQGDTNGFISTLDMGICCFLGWNGELIWVRTIDLRKKALQSAELSRREALVRTWMRDPILVADHVETSRDRGTGSSHVSIFVRG